MKLHIIFVLIDLMILLAYPVIYVVSKMRHLFDSKK